MAAEQLGSTAAADGFFGRSEQCAAHTLRQLDRPSGLSRVQAPDGSYWRERFPLRNDGHVELCEWRSGVQAHHAIRLSSGLLIFVVLCGRTSYEVGGQETLKFGEAFAHVIAMREGVFCTRYLSPGFGQEMMFTVPLCAATGVLGVSAEMLLRQHPSEDLGRKSGIRKGTLPLSASIAGSASRIFSAVADDPTRNALREARAWLMVCELLAELKLAGHIKPAPSIKWALNGRTRMLVERAADLLQNRPSDKHTIKSVARAVGLSRSALAEAFRRYHDTTLSDFLWRERMRRAELLLESSQLSISEIAASVGYGDPSSFTRAFRRFREITPRKLRCEGFCSGAATV